MKNKTVLVTGANGFLGQHLCLYLHEAGHHVVATGRGDSRLPQQEQIAYISADLGSPADVERLLHAAAPDVVIHNAAMSKPDECELNREACLKANVESTRYLLDGFAKHFIYISTDFIFGDNGPHAEDAILSPLNFYGQSKLMAEQLVTGSRIDHTIVRPVFIYGPAWQGMRGSFLHWVRNNLQQQKPLKITGDQQRTPTYAGDICKGIDGIIAQKATGVYHFAGKDILSPYDMALETATLLGLDASLLERVSADTFPEPVKRAKRSGLTCARAMRDLNYKPTSFAEGLRQTFGL